MLVCMNLKEADSFHIILFLKNISNRLKLQKPIHYIVHFFLAPPPIPHIKIKTNTIISRQYPNSVSLF